MKRALSWKIHSGAKGCRQHAETRNRTRVWEWNDVVIMNGRPEARHSRSLHSTQMAWWHSTSFYFSRKPLQHLFLPLPAPISSRARKPQSSPFFPMYLHSCISACMARQTKMERLDIQNISKSKVTTTMLQFSSDFRIDDQFWRVVEL
ncbi:hypothetical protein AVEN_119914-1 [Araneus ventricosus]|uniref:Uncharacterized protein n=1 Tax=Araneus ventricosus TaxID=182803 RepID=A0A4Y2MIE0_ARAVE|nr:hypothetical protein AVEN_119914-1 [Araneus ventricosus]